MGWAVLRNSIFTLVLLGEPHFRSVEASSQPKNTRVVAARKKNMQRNENIFALVGELEYAIAAKVLNGRPLLGNDHA